MIRVSAFKLWVMCFVWNAAIQLWPQDLHLTQRDVLETHGLSVLLFHNSYHKVFGDQKMSGLEIILEDQRIAKNGDVRLSSTPAQWDPIPEFQSRKQGSGRKEIVALCKYADQGLSYRLDLQPEGGGFRLAVQLDGPLPDSLVGKAGLNLEFLPSLYFGKSYLAGAEAGIFPRHADGPMERTTGSKFEPLPLAQGESFVLSPEDTSTRVTIRSESGSILLFDGRNQAQNGWFAVRTLIPPGKTGDVIVWHIQPNLVAGWIRRPVVGYNQVGYTPGREKVAAVEFDPLFDAPKKARVLRLTPQGDWQEAFSGEVRR